MIYRSENVDGNLHAATTYLNNVLRKQHPKMEVVTMQYFSAGSTVLVYRVPEARMQQGVPLQQTTRFMRRVKEALMQSTHPQAQELADHILRNFS